MELPEFIRKAVKDICEGVKDAKGDFQGIIAPHVFNEKLHISLSHIDFEISTIVKEEVITNLQGEISINSKIIVVSVDAKIDGERSSNNSNEKITKIKFSLPINFSKL